LATRTLLVLVRLQGRYQVLLILARQIRIGRDLRKTILAVARSTDRRLGLASFGIRGRDYCRYSSAKRKIPATA